MRRFVFCLSLSYCFSLLLSLSLSLRLKDDRTYTDPVEEHAERTLSFREWQIDLGLDIDSESMVTLTDVTSAEQCMTKCEQTPGCITSVWLADLKYCFPKNAGQVMRRGLKGSPTGTTISKCVGEWPAQLRCIGII